MRPIICFIDTPGALWYRSRRTRTGEAIATNLAEMMMFKTSIISVVISEGGSVGLWLWGGR